VARDGRGLGRRRCDETLRGEGAARGGTEGPPEGRGAPRGEGGEAQAGAAGVGLVSPPQPRGGEAVGAVSAAAGEAAAGWVSAEVRQITSDLAAVREEVCPLPHGRGSCRARPHTTQPLGAGSLAGGDARRPAGDGRRAPERGRGGRGGGRRGGSGSDGRRRRRQRRRRRRRGQLLLRSPLFPLPSAAPARREGRHALRCWRRVPDALSRFGRRPARRGELPGGVVSRGGGAVDHSARPFRDPSATLPRPFRF